ncbi:hypothetical protein V8C42DRAFT_318654 [Trichoderma barbatum]
MASRQVKLCFLTVNHPSDATTFESLSQIRSHVARDIHARAQESGSHVQRRKKSRGKSRKKKPEGPAFGLRTPASAAPLTGAEIPGATPATPQLASRLPSPLGTLNPQWTDPFQTFVRPLSTFEQSLMHHLFYIDEIENRRPRGSTISVAFISAAMGDKGQLAALLMRSCRSLARAQGSEDLDRRCLQYRGECIHSVRISLAADDIGDSTVLKIMMLAADHWLAGQPDGWQLHSNAVARIIKLRGGLDVMDNDSTVKKLIAEKPMFFPAS